MRLLMVEDEVRLAQAVRRGLTAEGFEVDLEHTGPDGLRAARTGRYDVILLDIMLPGLSGYRICQALREAGDDVPVLMLTAKNGEYDEADGLDLGADDYLTKPFAFVVLVARIKALLRRAGSARPGPYTAGDLTLDAATRRVARGETEIALTPREFAVLEHLMAHAGDVVSKADILSSVWDAFYAGDPNVVEVYVGYLRRKIDVPFSRHSVQTVRGVGYRLDAAGG
ncbi:MAG: response regulator transcription factor [Mycobacteriales bacterium]